MMPLYVQYILKPEQKYSNLEYHRFKSKYMLKVFSNDIRWGWPLSVVVKKYSAGQNWSETKQN